MKFAISNSFSYSILVSHVLFLTSHTLDTNDTNEDGLTNETEISPNANTVTRSFAITCCLAGIPVPDKSISNDVLDFTYEPAGPTFYKSGNDTCMRYKGVYSVALSSLITNHRASVGVHCKCAQKGLDRNCRSLTECQNGGYRSFRINLRCVCNELWFGESCEFYCYSGSLRKDSVMGVDVCQCKPNFYGHQCDKIQCFNRGTPAGRNHCSCLAPYVGRHCEIKLNSTSHLNGIRRSDTSFQRQTKDLSGSVLSLLLILGLSFAVYFMVRKRAQMTYRRAILRDIIANNRRQTQSGTSDWGLHVMNGNESPFSGEPPPYQVANACSMPPPPNYDEAIKLQPSNITVNNIGVTENVVPGIESPNSQVDADSSTNLCQASASNTSIHMSDVNNQSAHNNNQHNV